MNIELTAIVTIYKVEEYLSKCLDSLSMQTYENFRCLLVVGALDEECIKICKKYEKKDIRFETIISEPRGLSDARNVGIVATETEYITFIDGDDYLAVSAFETLMREIKTCDIVIGNYLVDDCKTTVKPEGKFISGIYSNKEALTAFLNGHGIQFVTAWGKVYRTSLFKEYGISYPVGKLHEDNLTTYKLLYRAKKIQYIDIPVYYYVDRPTSLSYNESLEKEKVIIDDLPSLREYLEGMDGIEENIDAYEIRVLISYIIRLAKSSDTGKIEYRKCVSELKKLNVFGLGHLRVRMKFLCFMIRTFPNISLRILGIRK